MTPFNSMIEARDYFWMEFCRQGGGKPVAKSCLVRFKGGVRQVTFMPGMVAYGSFVGVD